MKSHTLCLAGETFTFSWHSAPWRNPVPTHSGQSCHKDTHRTPTVNHIWQRPGVVTFTGTLKGDMEWPSVTEWNLFSCCMDQLFPSLIPAPHSAHSGLHSLFLPYTSGLIFLIAWYPSPRYIAKSLSLKNCPVITVWLNTHLRDKTLWETLRQLPELGKSVKPWPQMSLCCEIQNSWGGRYSNNSWEAREDSHGSWGEGRGWEGALCQSGFWNRRDRNTLHSWKYVPNTFL